jgi:hypothetical protein
MQNMRSHDPTRQDLRKQSTSLNSLGVFFLIAPFFSSSLTVDCSIPSSIHSFVYSCSPPTSTLYTSFVAPSPGLYTSKPLGRKTDTDLDLEARRGPCLVYILPITTLSLCLFYDASRYCLDAWCCLCGCT